jgi:Kef-type K+ transport system membrane component KefB
MLPEVQLIITLSLIIAFSPFIARISRIPTTPVEIILGSIAAYFHLISSHIELFEIIAEFGFLYLMFIAGTEVNIKSIIHTDKKILKRGIFYLIILYLLSFLFAHYLDFSKIFILIMPLISVGLVATLAKEFGNDMLWIQLSFIIGTIGEVMSIVLLTVAAAVIEFGVGFELAKVMLYFLLFMLAMTIIYRLMRILFWWYPEIGTQLMPHFDNKEQDIRLSMSILFLMISIMLILDLELAFGAFIAGIFIPNFFKHKEDLPHKLSSIGFGFIIPLFFVYIGSSFPLSALYIDGLVVMAFVIANIMILIRIVGAFVFYSSLRLRGTFLFALSHSMPLTLLIAVATLAHQSNSIDNFHYFSFILAALFEVIFSMIGIKLLHHIKLP